LTHGNNRLEQLPLPLDGSYLNWLDSVGEHLDDYEKITRLLCKKERVRNVCGSVFDELLFHGLK